MLIHSRGTSATTRNILKDLSKLLISYKENKYDQKDNLQDLRELMDINDCTSVIYFETTKRTEYVWIATEKGPSIKFNVYNLFTMRDLAFPTNCQKNAGHKLMFDTNFDNGDLLIVKQLFKDVFVESEVFDRIVAFFYYDEKIWMRVYGIGEEINEIGPRIVFEMDKVLENCFSGKVVYRRDTK